MLAIELELKSTLEPLERQGKPHNPHIKEFPIAESPSDLSSAVLFSSLVVKRLANYSNLTGLEERSRQQAPCFRSSSDRAIH